MNDPMTKHANGVMIHCPQTKEWNLRAAQWLAARIPGYNPENVTTMVVTMDGQVVSVVGYSRPHFNRIEISWASDTPRWVTRSSILYLLAPPFIQWGLHGVSMACYKKNKRVRKFVEGIGFKYEGTLRQAGTKRENIILYGFLVSDYAALLEKWRGRDEAEKFRRLVGDG